LWIFGNAICAAVGNVAYPFLYLLLALFSGASHLLISGQPMIGASGAINGIIGLTLVLFPKNRIHTFYWFAIPLIWLIKTGRFQTKTSWMILYWVVFDIIGVLAGGKGIAYWAHIGGFAGGAIIGLILLQLDVVDTYSPSLLDVLSGKDTDIDAAHNMDLETLAANQKSHEAAVALIPAGQHESANGAVQVSQPQEIPTVPDIQLSRCVGEGSTVTCYIVNKGATMKTPLLKVPQGVTAVFNCKVALHSRETGWIRFSTQDQSTIDSIEFIIGYTNTANEFHKMRFRCVPIARTLTLISSTESNQK
jgi:hypothetical protein